MNEDILFNIAATTYMSSSLGFNDDDNKDFFEVSNDMTSIFLDGKEDTLRNSLFNRSLPSYPENDTEDIKNPTLIDSANLSLWTLWEAEDRIRFAKGEVFNFRSYPRNSINPSKPIKISRLW